MANNNSWIIAIKANQENNLRPKGIIFEDIKMSYLWNMLLSGI